MEEEYIETEPNFSDPQYPVEQTYAYIMSIPYRPLRIQLAQPPPLEMESNHECCEKETHPLMEEEDDLLIL